MSQEIFVILFMGYACTNARGFPMESLERATKFRVRLGRDAQHQSQTEGAFFWDYSGIGKNSVQSAPDSIMNRMEGIRFTRNRQNTRSFGKCLAGNPVRPQTW